MFAVQRFLPPSSSSSISVDDTIASNPKPNEIESLIGETFGDTDDIKARKSSRIETTNTHTSLLCRIKKKNKKRKPIGDNDSIETCVKRYCKRVRKTVQSERPKSKLKENERVECNDDENDDEDDDDNDDEENDDDEDDDEENDDENNDDEDDDEENDDDDNDDDEDDDEENDDEDNDEDDDDNDDEEDDDDDDITHVKSHVDTHHSIADVGTTKAELKTMFASMGKLYDNDFEGEHVKADESVKMSNDECDDDDEDITRVSSRRIFSLADDDIDNDDNDDKSNVENALLQNILRKDIVDILRERIGLQRLFPMQRQVISSVLRMRRRGIDVCVAAPTGSGKTLCFALPILNTLASRIVPRLRALIVLPTRDLACQMQSVFQPFCDKLRLKIALTTGHRSFAFEQRMLVGNPALKIVPGGISEVDIVIATPGRLRDHLMGTPNFSLQHLEYLVIDEADRLMHQSYSDWVRIVLDSASNQAIGCFEQSNNGALQIHSTTIRDENLVLRSRRPPYLQKLLFSATLTNDPEYIASLRLRSPIFFSSTHNNTHRVPSSLTELYTVCKVTQKPLALKHILTQLTADKTLVFTSSVSACHRLYRLLELFNVPSIAEFSSALHQNERSRVMHSFRHGDIKVLVCSDSLSRGLDVRGVHLVVNYDVPSYVSTYMHRVGRTARAKMTGTACTIAAPNQVQFLRQLLQKVENSKLKRHMVPPARLESDVESYQSALNALELVLEAEQNGTISSSSSLRELWPVEQCDLTKQPDWETLLLNLSTPT